jgi:hypothetical protein
MRSPLSRRHIRPTQHAISTTLERRRSVLLARSAACARFGHVRSRKASLGARSQCHDEVVEWWSLSLDSWIVQDGNYPGFESGQQAEFAVELYFPEPPELTGQVAPRARLVGGTSYELSGRVMAIVEEAWVLDCGIGVYREQLAPPGIAVGDMVRGIANLGVDPFPYFERLHAFAGMPPLIYTWRIDEISRQAAPFVAAGSVLIRDPAKLGWLGLERTDAWHDDDGRAA